jgi:malto-oligosyltrehalose synthase
LQERAVTQFQQLSAPIAAKAVEDTAFYRYGRLLSRNDVGFDAAHLSDSVADFHAKALRRQAAFPAAMLATATHDHKRGEDARARLAVLSEHAAEWASALPRWIEHCLPLRRAVDGAPLPHAADIAMLLQMVVGAWPLDLDIHDNARRGAFAERLGQWQEKALREAKLATDWSLPNERYEAAARALLMSLVARNAAPELLSDIVSFAERISAAGAVNSLAQTLLKLTAPGVPDIYQGTEFWDFSLVDPDNRRPVDFTARAAGLDATPIGELAKGWRDGRIKQAVIAQVLLLRCTRPELFQGSYDPIEVRGEYADRVIAFARRSGPDLAIVVVPRAASGLLRNGQEIGFDPHAWKDTVLATRNASPLVNVFDQQKCGFDTATIAVGDLLEWLPFALLASPDIARGST